jgi:dienelactone hydrolase
MPSRFVLALLFILLPQLARAAEPVTFPAFDGVMVHADLYRPQGKPRGVLLLFHQAGSSRAEYIPIAPKLAALGWLALAVDQRSGGSYFGGRNLTAAGVRGESSYLAALPDLEAALAWSRVQWPAFRPAAWGSSYSAALVFLLAARHPADVSAVLAFSPGEYLSGASVRAAAAHVTAPIYVTSASDADEEEAAAAILVASPATVKRQDRAKSGVHGSATLRPDANPEGAAANFAAVAGWLDSLPGS